jgi:hypothetical protein
MSKQTVHPAVSAETNAMDSYAGPVVVDTFGVRVRVEWAPQVAVILC